LGYVGGDRGGDADSAAGITNHKSYSEDEIRSERRARSASLGATAFGYVYATPIVGDAMPWGLRVAQSGSHNPMGMKGVVAPLQSDPAVWVPRLMPM